MAGIIEQLWNSNPFDFSHSMTEAAQRAEAERQAHDTMRASGGKIGYQKAYADALASVKLSLAYNDREREGHGTAMLLGVSAAAIAALLLLRRK
ncbi:MAG TPA: hypothetical protein VGE85_11545 [Terracidiphilus sp.]|jgi:hypothetical protein